MSEQKHSQIKIPLTFEQIENLLNVLRDKLKERYFTVKEPDSIDIIYATYERSVLEVYGYNIEFEVTEDNQLKIVNFVEMSENECYEYIILNTVFANTIEFISIPEIRKIDHLFGLVTEVRYTDFGSYDIVTLIIEYGKYSRLIIVFAKGH